MAAQTSPIREQERAAPGRDPAALAPSPGNITWNFHRRPRETGGSPEANALIVDADLKAGDHAGGDNGVEPPAARPEVDVDRTGNRTGGEDDVEPLEARSELDAEAERAPGAGVHADVPQH